MLEGRGPQPPALGEIRSRLYAARELRVRPGLDDKRLCSWNALMISALAQAGAALGRPDYLRAASACAEFVLGEMVGDPDPARSPGATPQPTLLRTYKDGHAHIEAYLEDHAYLLEALLTLYEATLQPRWYDEAATLAATLADRFADSERGGFFTTAVDHDSGFARRKDLEDSPTPAGGSAAAFGLLRLARLSGDARWEDGALGVLRLVAGIVGRHPHGFGHALQAMDFFAARVREVALVGDGDPFQSLLEVVHGSYRPHVVLAGGPGDGAADDRVPLLRDRPLVAGQAAAYVCEGFVCRAPVTEAAALDAALS